MGIPETPVLTESQQIIQLLQEQNERLDRFAEAINSLGGNMEWLVSNVKGIFQMFGSPQFMQQLQQMQGMGGSPNG